MKTEAANTMLARAMVGATVAMLSCLPAAADLTNLRCEYRDNPLGINAAQPPLSWMIAAGGQKTEGRGQKQTSYQGLVASTPELLDKDQGDLWDSGKVVSDQSIQMEYAGKPFESSSGTGFQPVSCGSPGGKNLPHG